MPAIKPDGSGVGGGTGGRVGGAWVAGAGVIGRGVCWKNKTNVQKLFQTDDNAIVVHNN